MDHIEAEVRDLKRRVAELERRLLQLERAIRIAAAAMKDAGILTGTRDG